MKRTAIVMASTTGMSRAEWLDWRRKGLGGSDAAAVCGLSPWESPISVWLQKMGRTPDKEESEAMRQGRDLEDYVAKRFEEETGKTVRRRNAILAHPDHPWMLANIDREIVGENAGFEAKTASSYAEDQWADGKIPIQYQIQCHHYMAVTGADAWYIGCLILGRRFVWNRIDRDEATIDHLVSLESEFWVRHVLGQEMPPPDGSEESEEAITALFPAGKVNNDEEVSLEGDEWDLRLRRWYELNDLGDRIEKEQDEIKQRIMLAMGTAAIARLPGDVRIKWRTYSQRRIDSTALKRERPDLFAQYSRETAYRRFEVPDRA